MKKVAFLLLFCCSISHAQIVPAPMPSTGWACTYGDLGHYTDNLSCIEQFYRSISLDPSQILPAESYPAYHQTQNAFIEYEDTSNSHNWQSGSNAHQAATACATVDPTPPPNWVNTSGPTASTPSGWTSGSYFFCTWRGYTQSGGTLYGPWTVGQTVYIAYYCPSYQWIGPTNTTPPTCTSPAMCDAHDTGPDGNGNCSHQCPVTGAAVLNIYTSSGGIEYIDVNIHSDSKHGCNAASVNQKAVAVVGHAPPYNLTCPANSIYNDGQLPFCTCPVNTQWDGDACSAPVITSMSTPNTYTPVAAEPVIAPLDDVTLIKAWAASVQINVDGETQTNGSGEVLAPSITTAELIDDATGAVVNTSWTHTQTTSNSVLIDHWSATPTGLIMHHVYRVHVVGNGVVYGTGNTVSTAPYTVKVH